MSASSDKKLSQKIQRLFHDHPVITWNLIGVIFGIWIHWSLWLVLFIVSLVLLSKRYKELKIKKKEALIKEAQEYFDEIKKNKAFPTIATSVYLDEGEVALLQEGTALKETRAVRHSGGSFAGFRVAKGVRVGGYRGQSESTQEWRVLDRGDLVVTSKKLIFMGQKENRIMPLNKVMAIEAFTDSIEVTLQTKAKSIIFPVKNPYIWASTIGILRQVKDPLKLEGINLNIQLS